MIILSAIMLSAVLANKDDGSNLPQDAASDDTYYNSLIQARREFILCHHEQKLLRRRRSIYRLIRDGAKVTGHEDSARLKEGAETATKPPQHNNATKSRLSWMSMLKSLTSKTKADRIRERARNLHRDLVNLVYIYNVKHLLDLYNKDTYRSKTRFFRINDNTTEALKELFKPIGILDLQGYAGTHTNKSGSVRIVLARCFDNFKEMLTSLQSSSNTTRMSSDDVIHMYPSVVDPWQGVRNYLLSDTAVGDLISWLQEHIRQGIDDAPNELNGCRARMILVYSCCEHWMKGGTADWLKGGGVGKFARVRIKIG